MGCGVGCKKGGGGKKWVGGVGWGVSSNIPAVEQCFPSSQVLRQHSREHCLFFIKYFLTRQVVEDSRVDFKKWISFRVSKYYGVNVR